MKKILSLFVVAALLFNTGCASKQKRKFTVGFMPKLVGIPYFTACQKGAEEAAKELDVTLVYDGPTKPDSNQQSDLLSNWSSSGNYDVLAVACTERDAVSPALARAKK